MPTRDRLWHMISVVVLVGVWSATSVIAHPRSSPETSTTDVSSDGFAPWCDPDAVGNRYCEEWKERHQSLYADHLRSLHHQARTTRARARATTPSSTTLSSSSTRSSFHTNGRSALDAVPPANAVIQNIAVMTLDPLVPSFLLPGSYLSTSALAPDLTQTLFNRGYGIVFDRWNARGGLPILTRSGTLVPVWFNVTVFNVGWNGTAQATAITTALAGALAAQAYGTFGLVIPNYQSGVLPYSIAIEATGSAMVYNSLLSETSLYICTPPLPGDCITRGLTAGRRRFQYTYAGLPDSKYLIANGVAPTLHSEWGAQTVAFAGSTTSNATIFQPTIPLLENFPLVTTGVWTWPTGAVYPDLAGIADSIVATNADYLVIAGLLTEAPFVAQLLGNLSSHGVYPVGGNDLQWCEWLPPHHGKSKRVVLSQYRSMGSETGRTRVRYDECRRDYE